METASATTLAWLLSPHAIEPFFADHFEAAPLYIARGCPAYYDGVLSLRDLDAHLQNQCLTAPHVVFVKEGQNVHPARWRTLGNPLAPLDLDRLFRLLQEGHMLVLNNLHERVSSLTHCCNALEAELGVRCGANVYLTPAGTQGFERHYDPHDVFILQVAGSKAWDVYPEPTLLPDGGEVPGEVTPPEGVPEEIVLRTGDLLYLPRGIYHRARTEDEASVHVTLRIRPFKTYDLLHALAERARRHPALRRSAPHRLTPADARAAYRAEVRAALQALLRDVDVETLLADLEDQFIADRPPRTAQRLTELFTPQHLTVHTVLQARPHLLYRLWTEGRTCYVQLRGLRLKYPRMMAPLLKACLSGRAFQVGTLPGVVDEAARLQVVNRLWKQGLLMLQPGENDEV